VDVDSVSDVSAVHTSSIFMVEVCRVGEFPCILYIDFCFGIHGGSGAGTPSGPIGPVGRESFKSKETAFI
jgi:hypothetical protein